MRIAAWRSVRLIAGASRVVSPVIFTCSTRTSEESRNHRNQPSSRAARDQQHRPAANEAVAVDEHAPPARGSRLAPRRERDVAEQLHLGLELDAEALAHAAAALGDQRQHVASWSRRRGSR